MSFYGSNQIILNVLNSCETSKVIPGELEDMEVNAGQEIPIYQTFSGFTDSLSEDYSTENYCGLKKYTLLDSDLMNFIQLRSPQEGDSDGKFIIIVNARNEIEESRHEILIRAEFVDYPFAEAGIAKFFLNIAYGNVEDEGSDEEADEVPYYYINTSQESMN